MGLDREVLAQVVAQVEWDWLELPEEDEEFLVEDYFHPADSEIH